MEMILRKATKSHLQWSPGSPIGREEGGEVAGVAKDDRKEVEVNRLDGIRIIELEAEENISGGGVIEAARVRGGLEGRQWD